MAIAIASVCSFAVSENIAPEALSIASIYAAENNGNRTSVEDHYPFDKKLFDEAKPLAALYKAATDTILDSSINNDHYLNSTNETGTDQDILALPFDVEQNRVDQRASDLPKRKSTQLPLVCVLSSLLFPGEPGSISTLIKYEEGRRRIRDYLSLQRRFDSLHQAARRINEASTWAARVQAQWPWEPTPAELEILKKGCPALPMPVSVPDLNEFTPFFDWVARGGTSLISSSHSSGGNTVDGIGKSPSPVLLGNGEGEPWYRTPGLEFHRGVLYEDGRLDLCKQVVGPNHIGYLMESLRTNTFVRHFLLGNNIIGPVGAEAVADFVREFPDRIDTWYLAGNCIDEFGLNRLVDAMVRSKSITNIWLKRNPLGPGSAKALARLIIGCKNLGTLDLDQTDLGDEGVAELFDLLARCNTDNNELALRTIYLNGTGMSNCGAAALGRFLASPAGAKVESIYMSCNPVLDAGAVALAEHLPKAKSLRRLICQSIGIGDHGAASLCTALRGHPSLRVLDLGQSFATFDLGVGFNYVTDSALESMLALLTDCKALEYFKLTYNALSLDGLASLLKAAAESKTLLVYRVSSIIKYKSDKATSIGELALVSPTDLENLTRIVDETLKHNVLNKYGDGMTYQKFWDDERRWIVSDREQVRKIDSVYRTRDMASARRGEMILKKDWEDGDETLVRVMNFRTAISAS